MSRPFDWTAFQFQTGDVFALTGVARPALRRIIEIEGGRLGRKQPNGYHFDYCGADVFRIAVIARLFERGVCDIATAAAISLDALHAAIPFMQRDEQGKSKAPGVPWLAVRMTATGPESELMHGPEMVLPTEPIVLVPVGQIVAEILSRLAARWQLADAA